MQSMMDDITVKEALERLSLPTFFDDDKRMEAYYIIMETGNPVQKVLAEKAVSRFPIVEFFPLTAQAA